MRSFRVEKNTIYYGIFSIGDIIVGDSGENKLRFNKKSIEFSLFEAKDFLDLYEIIKGHKFVFVDSEKEIGNE